MAPTIEKPKVIANAMSIKLNILRSISVMQKCVGDPFFLLIPHGKSVTPAEKEVRYETRTDKAIQYRKHPVK